MTQLRASVIVDLAGNLAARARQYTGAITQMGQRGQMALRGLSGAAAAAGRSLDRVGNRYTAILGGAAGVGAIRMIVSLEERFVRLGIQANKGADEINALKKEIFDVATMRDVRVDPGEITSAIEAIIEKTGDLKFARDNIRNIGIAISGTASSGAAIGEIMSEFQKMGIRAPRDVLQGMDTLNVQGKEGAFTFAKLAALGPRVVTAYTSMGRTGLPALREMGAALQVIQQGTGSSEMAATAFEAVLRTVGDRIKVMKLRSAGIQVFDPDELKRGREVLRPINELMVDIVRRTGGKKTLLSEVFDAEAIRAFNSMSTQFQSTGGFSDITKFMQVSGDGAETLKNSAQHAATAAAALTNLHTAWKRFADSSLTGPIQSLADVLNSLGSETTGKVIKGLAIGAGVLGTAVVARKTYNAGRGILGTLTGKGAAAVGALGGGLPVPLPVYIVNAPAAGLGGAAAGAGGGRSSKGGKLAAMGMRAGQFAGVVGAAQAGWMAGSVINDWINSAASMFAGRDATLGTLIYDALHRDPMKSEVTIKIDSNGTPRVASMSTSSRAMELNVDAGLRGAGS